MPPEHLGRRRHLITAAGGNPTALEVIEEAMSPARCREEGRALLERFAGEGAEQAGFLLPSVPRLEMSGGELCVNGTRAAAMVLAGTGRDGDVTLSASGHEALVETRVEWRDEKRAVVSGGFADPVSEVLPVSISAGKAVCVDLGGIVHVLIEGKLPSRSGEQHRRIVASLGLTERGAVGVIWMEKTPGGVRIHPLVGVRAVETLVLESACGSGSIAAALVTGERVVEQPSGGVIEVHRDGGKIIVASEMVLLR